MDNAPHPTDNASNPPGELTAPAPRQLIDHHDARVARILDYQRRALEKEDALEANVGSINSGLMLSALWLDETLVQAMTSGPKSLERVQQLLPAIETHLRVTRQVDRFAQLELRAAEARKPKASEGHPTELASKKSSSPDGQRSNEDFGVSNSEEI